MLGIEYWVGAIIVLASSALIIGFRAPSLRVMLINLLAWLKGIPAVWVDSPSLAAKVLKASNVKGAFIEAEFAEPAWLPIISLESVDDPRWSVLKVRLVQLMKVLPAAQELEVVAAAVTNKYLATHDVLDANGIVYVTVASFFEWMFGRPFPADAQFVCDATWGWRKEIALKGPGDKALKQRVVDWFVAEVRQTPHLWEVFGEKWAEPEYFSVVLQPFIVSPAINVSDVAVTVATLYAREGSLGDNMGDFLNKALDVAHPFVILERFLPDGLTVDGKLVIAPGSQVFIPIDGMPIDSAIRFGAGARRCPGMQQGTSVMLGIFQKHVVESPKFQPTVGHLYSGRDQDGMETLPELLYQGKTIGAVILKALRGAVFGTKQ